MRKIRKSERELSEKVIKLGYSGINDFFKKNPISPYTVLAKITGVSYQTISRHHKQWLKRIKEA